MNDGVVLHEVGLRDGLQMEEKTVPTPQKLTWAAALAGSGVDILQLGSFVHPGKVPQMADTDELFRRGLETGKAVLSALVLNEKGLERGLACGVEMFCMGVSASETHSRKNTGMGVDEALERIIAMARQAGAAGKKVQVSVQSAFGCGYEGPVDPARVMRIVGRYLDAGLQCVSLADTAGHATPDRVEEMFGRVRKLGKDLECACHFHNTYGLALANCWAALRAGVRIFESSVAGLGGCPFTKIAGGNTCTEDLVHMLQHMGLRRDVRLDALVETAQGVAGWLGRELPGAVYRTGPVGLSQRI
ncbi:MAG: hydroxymethylglutaryl-CoA lyase [Bacteroidota bacterium]